MGLPKFRILQLDHKESYPRYARIETRPGSIVQRMHVFYARTGPNMVPDAWVWGTATRALRENSKPITAGASYRREATDMRQAMRLLLIMAFTVWLTAECGAACVCRCVDGVMQPLCDSSIDLPPICPITVCAIAPPSIKPIQPLGNLPIGTSQCSQRQVLNPNTRQYEWRSVCN
jgi:hypothetical protein